MDDEGLAAELLAMAAEDLRVRGELVRDGSLYAGYQPRMREVHERNAARLLAVLDAHGWPGRARVGERAAEAAWRVLQHAIGNPVLQRRGLALLKQAQQADDVPLLQVAMLEDRVRSCEGRGQVYGTQFDWDEQGRMSPLPIEDEANVDARRHAIGLGPLSGAIERQRATAEQEGARPPADWNARVREKEAWLRSCGWRD